MQHSNHTAPLHDDVEELKRSLTRATRQLNDIYRSTTSKARLLTPYYARRLNRPAGASSSRILSTELARFDAVCDRMEFTLAKAIINTRRAIEEEEGRLNAMKDITRVASLEGGPRPTPEPAVPQEPIPAGALLQNQDNMKVPDTVPSSHSASVDPRLRRPSTITLSSLKGTRTDGPFPPKLDLSATSLGLDDDIIPGLFNPSGLVTTTGLHSHTGVEVGSTFDELSVDLSHPDAVFSAEGIPVDMEHGDHQERTTSHTNPETLHLDQNMDSLFTELASATSAGNLATHLELSPTGIEHQRRANKDTFPIDIHEAVAGPNQVVDVRAPITEQFDSAKDMSVGGDALPLDHSFDHPDFSSLSPSIFSQLDPSNTSQFDVLKSGVDLTGLESMENLFGGEIDSGATPNRE